MQGCVKEVNMIGDKYWATGISLKHIGDDHWTAEACFYDDGFCNIQATEGKLQSRYRFNTEDVQVCVATLKSDVERLGITFKAVRGRPNLYVEIKKDEEKPESWREVIEATASAIDFILLVDDGS
jgi:hypothetical protein